MLPRRSLRKKVWTKYTDAEAAVSTSENNDNDIGFEPPAKKIREKIKSKKISEEEKLPGSSKKVKLSAKKLVGAELKEAEVKKSNQSGDGEEEQKWQTADCIYEFSARDINGKMISMSEYRGHVCIIVNVASRCGHTKSNYEQFVEIFNQYSGSKGLRILAFPCNQFGKQEPGDSSKISEFIKKRNVKFDVFEKIEVNGKNAHPLWKFLKSKIAGPKGNNIDWNFTKFIVDREGKVVERQKPSVKPVQMVSSLEKYW